MDRLDIRKKYRQVKIVIELKEKDHKEINNKEEDYKDLIDLISNNENEIKNRKEEEEEEEEEEDVSSLLPLQTRFVRKPRGLININTRVQRRLSVLESKSR